MNRCCSAGRPTCRRRPACRPASRRSGVPARPMGQQRQQPARQRSQRRQAQERWAAAAAAAPRPAASTCCKAGRWWLQQCRQRPTAASRTWAPCCCRCCRRERAAWRRVAGRGCGAGLHAPPGCCGWPAAWGAFSLSSLVLPSMHSATPTSSVLQAPSSALLPHPLADVCPGAAQRVDQLGQRSAQVPERRLL